MVVEVLLSYTHCHGNMTSTADKLGHINDNLE